MDDEYYKSVISTFVKLYKEGLIYRGKRMINWDPKGLTALSDEEVIHKEQSGKLWYIKYPISNSDQYLIVATTRPETMLGDTGVAINPKDKRYKDFDNRMIDLPIVNKQIPILSDSYVDIEFGTGCVKVTPAHDPNDFDMAQRNNLDILNIMNENGTLNKNVPKEFQSLDRFEARKLIISKLKDNGQLVKIESIKNKVPYGDRSNTIIEPLLTEQWFVDSILTS
jgi:valyl-tRNA synthetase